MKGLPATRPYEAGQVAEYLNGISKRGSSFFFARILLYSSFEGIDSAER